MQQMAAGRTVLAMPVNDRLEWARNLSGREHSEAVSNLRRLAGNSTLTGRPDVRGSALRQQTRQRYYRLLWQCPGSVWAIDFAEPSWRGASWSLPPIDGRDPALVYNSATVDVRPVIQLELQTDPLGQVPTEIPYGQKTRTAV